MTAHGPEAIRVVIAALDRAGVGPDVPTEFILDLVGDALGVIAGIITRDATIDALVAAHDLARPFVTKALDLAVEALTATEEPTA